MATREEREAIWAIQIRKYRRDPDRYDLAKLAGATEGFTGAEIEQAYIDSLYAAFAAGKEPTELSIALALSESVPLSRLKAEEIKGLRAWAKGRARPATSPEEGSRGRRIAA